MKIKRIVILILIAAVTAFAAGGMVGEKSAAVAVAAYESLPNEETIVNKSAFDGRNYGIVTGVRDQGGSNLCWAYSSAAASETSILRSGINPAATNENLVVNPVAAAYRIARRGSDPLNNTNGAYESGDYTLRNGNPSEIASLYSAWWGPVVSADATTDPFVNPSYRLETAAHIPENKDDENERILAIKRAVAKCGAVTFQYNNLRNAYYYNPLREQGAQSSPHACTIIGWDDGIDASRFEPSGATRNGGWLIKNSYSDLPYFYLSYDNTSSHSYAFEYVNASEYDRNYYYDGDLTDFPLRSDKCVANVYEAKGGEDGKTEFLKAVNVGVSGENYTLEVEVYKNLGSPFGATDAPINGGASAAKTTASFGYGGYVTVRLDEEIELSAGEWFSVIVRVTSGDAKIRLGNKNGKDLSYASGGYGWSKIGNYVGRIKALTVLRDDKPDEWNFTNLLVFAKFAGENEFINDVHARSSVREIVDNTYNKSTFSVADYIKSVSGGKVNARTLYLTNGGSSLTLARSRGYYTQKDDLNPDGYESSGAARMYDLKQDWTSALNAAISAGNKLTDADGKTYDYSVLDKNSDGKIDAVTVIYAQPTTAISVDWSSPLWDYEDYCDMVEFSSGGKTYRSAEYVQLTFSYRTGDSVSLYKGDDGLPVVSLGKVCHETMHVFGLKDLYRSDQTSAVYYMSLMGKPTSPVGQFISVKEREALGWLDSTEVVTMNRAGEYTLGVASASRGKVVGYKIDLPTGKTLYLEYRKFNGSENKYDSYEKTVYSCRDDQPVKLITSLKSGLVCYLVNTDTRFPSNLGTSGSRWNFEVASHGQYSTRTDCAVGVNESLDISGGIYVEVTEITDTYLSFYVDGDAFNAAHVHNLEEIKPKLPTCTEDGNIGYYECSSCGKFYTDASATVELSASEIALPIDPAAHSYGNLIPETAPTCTAAGVRAHYRCGLCGKTFGSDKTESSAADLVISADPTAHSYGEWINEVAATTEKTGVKAHKDCNLCDKHFDADGNEIADLTIPKIEDKPSENPDKPSGGDSDNPSDKPSDEPNDKPNDNPSDKPNESGGGDNETDPPKNGLGAGATAAVAVSGAAVAGAAIFAIAWFAVKKKSWGDLAAAIKRLFKR